MHPNDRHLFEDFQAQLRGQNAQPLIFGVCAALAQRGGFNRGPVRLIALLALVFFTMPVLLAYVIAGFLLPETRDTTKTRLLSCARWLVDRIEAMVASVRGSGNHGTS